jgi:hypothetical protein
MFCNDTLALGIAAPAGSVTCPVRLAPAAWANARCGTARNTLTIRNSPILVVFNM